MRSKIVNTLMLAALIVFASASGWAQATLGSTTLSAAINDSQTTFVVASASPSVRGIVAGTMSAYVDRELMAITGVSGTTITVRRGQGGILSPHVSGATIYIDLNQYFGSADQAGACTSTNEPVLPLINTNTGNRWNCTGTPEIWAIAGGPATILTGVTAVSPDTAGTRDVGVAGTAFRTYYGTSILNFEGSTADAVETTITVTDPTSADANVTIPDFAGTNVAGMFSTLTTNSLTAANSVFGVSNKWCFEGATADAFEACITPADPAIDTDITIPAVASGAATIGQSTVTWAQGGVVANAVDGIFFIADRIYTVKGIKAVWGTAESTGSMDVMVEKLTGTTACASGTDLLTAAFDATGTANTVGTGSLSATPADLELAVGDRLCVDLTATPNEVVNLTVSIALEQN